MTDESRKAFANLEVGNDDTSMQSTVQCLDIYKRRVAICAGVVITVVVVGALLGIGLTAGNTKHKDSGLPTVGAASGVTPGAVNPDFTSEVVTPDATRDVISGVTPDVVSPYVTSPVTNAFPGAVRPPVYTRPPGIPDYVWNMTKMMSDSHPCDDFYQYACGRWLEENPAADYEIHSAIQSMRHDVRQILRDLLDRPSSTQESEAVQKAKKMYKSCMDMSSINAQASEPLMTILADVDNHTDVIDMLVAMRKYNSHPLGFVTVTKDAKNTTRNVILLDEPYLTERRLVPGVKAYIGYKNFYNEVSRQLDLDQYGRGYRVIGNVDNLLDFQHGLTQLTTKWEDRPGIDGLYHMYTLGSLNDNFPKFDWKRFVRGVFSQSSVNITLTEDQPVLVYAPEFFRRVGGYLLRSDPSTVRHYARVKLVQDHLDDLPERYRTAWSKYLAMWNFKVHQGPRWEICTPLVDRLLFNITGRMYVEKEFDPEAMAVTKDMVQDMRKVFRKRMQADSWMDSKTKQTALEKLDAIHELIGYPPDIMNDTLLDQLFEDLVITDRFFENVITVVKRREISHLRSLHQPTRRDTWNIGATTVNAYYRHEENRIAIPAGFVRKPVFSIEYPKSVIYANLGSIVAHELTHAFDNTGRKYDKEGNLIDWWSDIALAAYKQRASCYVHQYFSYRLDDSQGFTSSLYVNGTKTLGENIADNGGLRDAFKAYTEWVSRQTNVSTVPYLGLTNNQVFYLAFAQYQCETRGLLLARQEARIDPHSPRASRVKGTLQNSNHFAKTFNCKRGTPMNPLRQKCRIW